MSMKAGQLWIVKTAEELSCNIRKSVMCWDKLDRYTIGVQLIRSADSIGANIVEGYGRAHRLDGLRFYSIARGSLEETMYWIRRSKESHLISESLGKQWLSRYKLLSVSINRFIQTSS